jgi:hypothetical protein
MHINVALNPVGKSTQGEDEWIKAYCDLSRQTITDQDDLSDYEEPRSQRSEDSTTDTDTDHEEWEA